MALLLPMDVPASTLLLTSTPSLNKRSPFLPYTFVFYLCAISSVNKHVSCATKPNGVLDRRATTSSGAETSLLARPTRVGSIRMFGQHLPVDDGRGNIQAHGGAAAV